MDKKSDLPIDNKAIIENIKSNEETILTEYYRLFLGSKGIYQYIYLLIGFSLGICCNIIFMGFSFFEVKPIISYYKTFNTDNEYNNDLNVSNTRLDSDSSILYTDKLEYSLCNSTLYSIQNISYPKYSIISEFDFYCDENLVGLFCSSSFVGVLVGSFIFIYFSHYYERKKGIIINSLCFALSLFILSINTSIYLLFLFMFISQAFSTSMYYLYLIGLIESSDPLVIPFFNVILGITYSIAGIIFSTMFFYYDNWRIAFLSASIISFVFSILYYFYIYEHPSFYLTQKNINTDDLMTLFISNSELIAKHNGRLEIIKELYNSEFKAYLIDFKKELNTGINITLLFNNKAKDEDVKQLNNGSSNDSDKRKSIHSNDSSYASEEDFKEFNIEKKISTFNDNSPFGIKNLPKKTPYLTKSSNIDDYYIFFLDKINSFSFDYNVFNDSIIENYSVTTKISRQQKRKKHSNIELYKSSNYNAISQTAKTINKKNNLRESLIEVNSKDKADTLKMNDILNKSQEYVNLRKNNNSFQDFSKPTKLLKLIDLKDSDNDGDLSKNSSRLNSNTNLNDKRVKYSKTSIYSVNSDLSTNDNPTTIEELILNIRKVLFLRFKEQYINEIYDLNNNKSNGAGKIQGRISTYTQNCLNFENISIISKTVIPYTNIEASLYDQLFHLFRHEDAKLRRNFIIMNIIWFTTIGLYTSYSILTKDLSGSLYINNIINYSLEIVMFILVPILIRSLKRLGTYNLLFGFNLISATMFLIIKLNYIRTVLSLFCRIIYSGLTCLCLIYSVEVYPLEFRANGLSFNNIFGTIGAIIFPIIIEKIDIEDLNMINVVLSALCLFLIYFLPEI